MRYADVNVGDLLPPLTKPPITKRQLVMYAGASGDFNPIHYDDPFAREGGHAQVIAHGMLSMAFFGQLVGDFAGPGAIAQLSARFKAVTYPGDVITSCGEVIEKRDDRREVVIRLIAKNAAGAVTLEGSAVVRLE